MTDPLGPAQRRFLSYEYVEELEDPLVGQNVQDVAGHGVDDGQPVDLVLE